MEFFFVRSPFHIDRGLTAVDLIHLHGWKGLEFWRYDARATIMRDSLPFWRTDRSRRLQDFMTRHDRTRLDAYIVLMNNSYENIDPMGDPDCPQDRTERVEKDLWKENKKLEERIARFRRMLELAYKC